MKRLSTFGHYKGNISTEKNHIAIAWITNWDLLYYGYNVLRKNNLEAIALTGKTEGKRARGRQRKMFLDWVSFACGSR